MTGAPPTSSQSPQRNPMLQLFSDTDSPDPLAIVPSRPRQSRLVSTDSTLSSGTRRGLVELDLTSPKRRRDAEHEDEGAPELSQTVATARKKRGKGRKKADVSGAAEDDGQLASSTPDVGQPSSSLDSLPIPQPDFLAGMKGQPRGQTSLRGWKSPRKGKGKSVAESTSGQASPRPASSPTLPEVPDPLFQVPTDTPTARDVQSDVFGVVSSPVKAPERHGLDDPWLESEVCTSGKIVWVAARSKNEDGHLWWPAKVASSAGDVVKVDLFCDAFDEVASFSDTSFTIKPSPSTILTFKTKATPSIIRFPSIQTATSAGLVEHPSIRSFASAVGKANSAAIRAAIDDDDELPDANDAMALDVGSDALSYGLSQQSNITLTQSSPPPDEEFGLDYEDEAEEEEPEFDPGPDIVLTLPGEVVLAREKPPERGGDWWPAKLLSYAGFKPFAGSRKGRPSKKKPRRVPQYAVQFCDGVEKELPREWFLSYMDEDFGKVQIGRLRSTETKTSVEIEEGVTALLPSLEKIVRGLEDPVNADGVNLRTEFLAGGQRRRRLADRARYGSYTEEAVSLVGKIIKDRFSPEEAGRNEPIGDEEFLALDSAARTLFCSDVLVPHAIRLLTIDEYLEDAEAELHEERKEETEEEITQPLKEAIRQRATELADRCLDEEDMVTQIMTRRGQQV